MTVLLPESMVPQKSIEAVGDELLQLTNTLRTIALQRPSDPEAQRRARAAVDFYSDVPEFPPLTEPRQPEDDHEQRVTVTFKYPLEIYSAIIGHVAAERPRSPWLEERAKTLEALACSCRLFQALTEPYLYTYPRSTKLKKREAQWRFRFALAVEPRRATLVRALKIYWHDEPSNSRLLIDTARTCPNVHRLKMNRSLLETDNAEVHKQQMNDLAELFDACPQVTSFNYKTKAYLYPFDYPESPQDDRFSRFAQRLSEVKIRGPTGWFWKSILPYLSSNLVSLILGGEYDEEKIPDLFTALCRQCPSMQNLDLRISLNTPNELMEACRTWGPTLRHLRLYDVRNLPNTIAQLIPFMSALEDIIVVRHFMHMSDDIKAMAQTRLPRLKTFVCVPTTMGIDEVFSDGVPPDLNTALVGMITLHGPTLQCLGLGDGPRVDERVVKSLKKATNLEDVGLGLPKDLETSAVEDVLDTCPKLKHRFEIETSDYQKEMLEVDRILSVGDLGERFRDLRSFSGSWAPGIRDRSSFG